MHHIRTYSWTEPVLINESAPINSLITRTDCFQLSCHTPFGSLSTGIHIYLQAVTWVVIEYKLLWNKEMVVSGAYD